MNYAKRTNQWFAISSEAHKPPVCHFERSEKTLESADS